MERLVLNWSELLNTVNNNMQVKFILNSNLYIVFKDYATEFYVIHIFLNLKSDLREFDYQISIPSVVKLRKMLVKIGVDFE